MAHLSNKNKALNNPSLNLKTDNQAKKTNQIESMSVFCTDHLLQNFKI